MPKNSKQSASAWDSIQAMLEEVMERRIARSRRVASSVPPASEPIKAQTEGTRFKERIRKNRATG
jgi:hypothetical protein